MEHPLASSVLAVAISSVIIFFGAYVLRRIGAPQWTRVACGVVALTAGVSLGYPLVFGDNHPLSNPALLGAAAGFVGVGINQLGSPARVKRRAVA